MSKNKSDTVKVYRSSETGQFVSKEKVKSDPKKTETERRPARKPTALKK
jgi:hypothetical protein